MQTFLPYPDYTQSAKCLDNKRLGKQRVECLQILSTLLGESQGWKNHPAVRMWRGYEPSLVHYTVAVCLEWKARGFKDTIMERLDDLMLKHGFQYVVAEHPRWLGSEIHASHRSNLLRKDAEHYGSFGWEEDDTLPYVWPGGIDRNWPREKQVAALNQAKHELEIAEADLIFYTAHPQHNPAPTKDLQAAIDVCRSKVEAQSALLLNS